MADPTDEIMRIINDGGPDTLSRIASVLGMDQVEQERDQLRAELSRLQADNERLKAELDDMEAARDEALQGPWEEWAEQIRKRVREGSGYDGYDDTDGVDLPGEVSEHLDEVEAMAERERTERIKAQGEAKALAAMVDRLQAGGGEVVELLRQLEWSGSYYDQRGEGTSYCPSCEHDRYVGQVQQKHASNCDLNNILTKLAAHPAAPAKVLVPLSDEQINKLWAFGWTGDRVAFIRAIEAASATHNGLTLGTDGGKQG